MPLLTKILKPSRFTPENIAQLMASSIGFEIIPLDVLQNMETTAGYVIEQLHDRGIISQSAILDPAKFNSTTIAMLMWEKAAGPKAWDQGTQDAQRITIDQAQYVLDALYREGIIG